MDTDKHVITVGVSFLVSTPGQLTAKVFTPLRGHFFKDNTQLATIFLF